MNQDSKEFTAILAKVPKYILLQPGVDKLQPDDEILFDERDDKPCPNWQRKGDEWLPFTVARRPVPESIRRSEAQLIMDNQQSEFAKFILEVK